MKRPPTPTAELLAEAGKLIYGEYGWSGALGAALEVNPRTLVAYASGKQQLKPDHSMMRDVIKLLEKHRDEVTALVGKIHFNAVKRKAS